MPNIKKVEVHHTEQVVRVTLDDETLWAFSFEEYEKLLLVNLANFKAKPRYLTKSMVINHQPFSQAIQAAMTNGTLTFHEALVVQDYTNRGFANSNASTDGNLLYQGFPRYWDFLLSYRMQINDPHVT